VNALLSGRVRRLNRPRKVILLVVVVVVAYAGVRLTTAFVLERLNEARFRDFSLRIAPADHIIVTDRLNRPPAFTIPGEDAKTFVRGVASSRRMKHIPWGYDVPPFHLTATFLAGTNALGDISSNGDLLQFNGKTYWAHSNVVGRLTGRYSGPSQSPTLNQEPR